MVRRGDYKCGICEEGFPPHEHAVYVEVGTDEIFDAGGAKEKPGFRIRMHEECYLEQLEDENSLLRGALETYRIDI